MSVRTRRRSYCSAADFEFQSSSGIASLRRPSYTRSSLRSSICCCRRDSWRAVLTIVPQPSRSTGEVKGEAICGASIYSLFSSISIPPHDITSSETSARPLRGSPPPALRQRTARLAREAESPAPGPSLAPALPEWLRGRSRRATARRLCAGDRRARSVLEAQRRVPPQCGRCCHGNGRFIPDQRRHDGDAGRGEAANGSVPGRRLPPSHRRIRILHVARVDRAREERLGRVFDSSRRRLRQRSRLGRPPASGRPHSDLAPARGARPQEKPPPVWRCAS